MSVALDFGGGLNRWAANMPLDDYRAEILELWPNGDVHLFAMSQALKRRELTNYKFSWHTYNYPRRGGALTNVYTDSGMTSAYSSGGVAGATLYLKVAEAVADHFVPGKQALIRVSTDITADVRAIVTAVDKNGANSKITVTLLEADDNSLYSKDMSDADTVFVSGSMNPQGGAMHTAVRYKKTEATNATQIFVGPVKMSRTQSRIATREYGQSPEKARGSAKLEALNYISSEIESAFHVGQYSDGTGDNNEPLTSMRGLATSIQEYAPDNVSVYPFDTDYTGLDWTVGGEDWLNAYLKKAFKSSPVGPKPAGGRTTRRPGYCGMEAFGAIKQLAAAGSTMQLTPKDTVYGFQVWEWWSDYGVVELYVHPYYTLESSFERSLLVFDWSMLTYCTLDDLEYYDDPSFIAKNWGHTGKVDGVLECWLAEISLEVHHPSMGTWLHGMGIDNDLS